MKIKDLRKVDVHELKKLDFAKIQEGILAKPDIAVNVALVLLSLIWIFQIFASLQKNLNELKGKLENSEKKGAAIDTYNATQKQFRDFIDNLPKGISEDKVIDKLTDFAAKREVQIISVSPSERDSKKLYDKVVVNLNIVVKGYKNLCLFINDIENPPYALRL